MLGYIIATVIVVFLGYKGVNKYILAPRSFQKNEADGIYSPMMRAMKNAEAPDASTFYERKHKK